MTERPGPCSSILSSPAFQPPYIPWPCHPDPLLHSLLPPVPWLRKSLHAQPPQVQTGVQSSNPSLQASPDVLASTFLLMQKQPSFFTHTSHLVACRGNPGPESPGHFPATSHLPKHSYHHLNPVKMCNSAKTARLPFAELRAGAQMLAGHPQLPSALPLPLAPLALFLQTLSPELPQNTCPQF